MNRRRLTLAIASAAVLAAGPVALSASASAAQPARASAAVPKVPNRVAVPAAGGGYMIVSEMDRKMCLTTAGTFNGALIDMEGCDFDHRPAYQLWMPGANGNFQSVANLNMCLDDRYNNPGGGAATDLWACNPWPAQYWTYNLGQHELDNANGNCLDISDANDFWGAAVKLFPCKGVSNQHWYLQ